jgi:hypothetical protein
LLNVFLKQPPSLSQSGTTALFFAAQQGHNDVVRFLFGFGASTECRTKVRDSRSWVHAPLVTFKVLSSCCIEDLWQSSPDFRLICNTDMCFSCCKIQKPKEAGFLRLLVVVQG